MGPLKKVLAVEPEARLAARARLRQGLENYRRIFLLFEKLRYETAGFLSCADKSSPVFVFKMPALNETTTLLDLFRSVGRIGTKEVRSLSSPIP